MDGNIGHRLRVVLGRASILVLVVGLVATASASAQTVVSLTFDNGLASQYTVRSALAAHGMHGTFFVNSDNVGSNSYYMSWSQIRDLASDGNDIGGQTLDNVKLTSVSTSEAQRQVCDDRSKLIAQGFSASSFAYPYSSTNATVEGIVQQCGYATARKQGGIYDPVECLGCAYANAIPPSDPFNLRGTEWLGHPYALGDLEGWVSRAQSAGGGLVPIVFDDICDTCGAASSASSSTLQSFLDWLTQQGSGTVVQTMRQVVPPAHGTPPQTTIACDNADCGATFKNQVNVTLTASDSDSNVASTHYTSDGSAPTSLSPAYTGALQLSTSTTVKFRSWDVDGNVEAIQSQYVHVTSPTVVSLTFDDGISTQYQARSILAAHGMHGTFLINSNKVGTSSYYMTWPQIHDIASDGNDIGGHTLDHLDLTTLTTAQVQSQVCDDRSNLINQGFSVSSFAYPFSRSTPAVDAIVQQCGYAVARKIGGLNDPTDCGKCAYGNAIPPANPYEVLTPVWETRPFTLQDLEGWITQAEDKGGGWVPLVFHDICDTCGFASSVSASTMQSFLDWMATRTPQTVVKTMRQVVPPPDSTPPTTTMSCGGSSCGGWYKAAVSVSLNASDPDSGIASTRYTIDGSEPTAQSPSYTGPFNVSATTTVRYRSWDVNGNVELTNSQQIQVDATPPSTTISCAGGSGCPAAWYGSPLSVGLNPSDGGSGVASTHYTTDGSAPTLQSPTYSAPFNLTTGSTATVTVRFRSWDIAGNAEPSHSTQIRIDAAAPSTQIFCGSSSCSSTHYYSRSTKITLKASDTGSGVGSIHYTTDGSVPTLTSPAYTGGFALPGTKTVSYRSWDKVGNVETTRLQVIHVF